MQHNKCLYDPSVETVHVYAGRYFNESGPPVVFSAPVPFIERDALNSRLAGKYVFPADYLRPAHAAQMSAVKAPDRPARFYNTNAFYIQNELRDAAAHRSYQDDRITRPGELHRR